MDNKFFKSLIDSNDTYIIHYASNGIYEFGAAAPNISCIAICNINTNFRKKFFIGDYLENNSLEQAEKLALQKFADFIAENKNSKFIHWGMNADGFGFRAINARCKKLGIAIAEIPSENIIDLSEMVSNIAGKKLSIKQILMMNQCYSEEFLTGKEEVDAFNNKEYNKIFDSVASKVIGFSCITENIAENQLVTAFSNKYSPTPYSKEKEQALREIAEYRENFFAERRNLIKNLEKRETEYQKRILSEEVDNVESELWLFSSDPLLTLFANIGNFFKK